MFGIVLDRANAQPMKRQLYSALKACILSGRLRAGDALPSTRELAKALNISRCTASEAYDMLLSEGYAVSRQGAPTRIAEGLLLEAQAETTAPKAVPTSAAMTADFRTGRPDLRLFPKYLWRQLMHDAAGALPLAQYGYGGPQGLPSLRAEISAWLARSRGLAVSPDDIFITAGATHALHILADLLCRDGGKLLIEDPCNASMLETFLQRGCDVQPVPADSQGLRTQCLTGGEEASAVYVTPSHGFPLGGILPAPRRAALIRFARAHGLYVIEDDYDSEFRYMGDPVAPLYAMDPKRVVYVGTFSKVLFPALRIGYAILPEPLHAAWRVLRTHTDVQNPPFEQAALAEFLHTRKLDRHLMKMRRLYGHRRAALLESLRAEFPDGWTACGDAAGLHIAVEFPGMRFGGAFEKLCAERGIRVAVLERHAIRKGAHEDKLLIGFGHLDVAEIRQGVRHLADAIRDF